MYHIDAILMSPSEAAVRAARTGQDEWLLRLLRQNQCNVPLTALVTAAANGHPASVLVLTKRFFINGREYCTAEGWSNLLQAVVAAGSNGHIHVMRYLLPEVKYSGVGSRKWEVCSHLLDTFKAAAVKGYLDVAECALQHARTNGLLQRFASGVGGELLACVIAGRKHDVVEYLLALDGFQWNLRKAFVAAVETEQDTLAEILLGRYRQLKDDRKIFIGVAQGGHLSAVRRLYDYGRVDAELIDEAFVKVAEFNRVDVIAFLYDTGKVSPEAFDEALLAAVTSMWRSSKTIEYLCAQGCASAVTINQAFKIASSANTIKILYEKADISDASIISAFRTAAGCGIEYFTGSSDEDVKIIQFLLAHKCIPVDVIAEAFLVAVKTGRTQLVELFRSDVRISTDTMDKAFVQAATREDCSVMRLLYDQKRISPDALVEAFKRAAANQLLATVKEIVRCLSDESHVPREVKYKAFLTAAALAQVDALRIVCQSEKRGWPLVILKGALDIAGNDQVKAFIREVTCNQLFDPNAPERFDSVAKAMDN
jgi:hypothetical protein